MTKIFFYGIITLLVYMRWYVIMKIKHKEFILGIILGAIIFGTSISLAEEIFQAFLNPFKII
mgnify:CR=1 FL=1